MDIYMFFNQHSVTKRLHTMILTPMSPKDTLESWGATALKQTSYLLLLTLLCCLFWYRSPCFSHCDLIL